MSKNIVVLDLSKIEKIYAVIDVTKLKLIGPINLSEEEIHNNFRKNITDMHNIEISSFNILVKMKDGKYFSDITIALKSDTEEYCDKKVKMSVDNYSLDEALEIINNITNCDTYKNYPSITDFLNKIRRYERYIENIINDKTSRLLLCYLSHDIKSVAYMKLKYS